MDENHIRTDMDSDSSDSGGDSGAVPPVIANSKHYKRLKKKHNAYKKAYAHKQTELEEWKKRHDDLVKSQQETRAKELEMEAARMETLKDAMAEGAGREGSSSSGGGYYGGSSSSSKGGGYYKGGKNGSSWGGASSWGGKGKGKRNNKVGEEEQQGWQGEEDPIPARALRPGSRPPPSRPSRMETLKDAMAEGAGGREGGGGGYYGGSSSSDGGYYGGGKNGSSWGGKNGSWGASSWGGKGKGKKNKVGAAK